MTATPSPSRPVNIFALTAQELLAGSYISIVVSTERSAPLPPAT
jgi:hypothetical protein